MITVKKVGNELSPDIEISDGVNAFMIARNNLPDLCWFPKINSFKYDEDIVFTLTEVDGDIHSLFNKLYQDVTTGNIFPLKEEDYIGKTPVQLKRIKQAKEAGDLKNLEHAKRSGLVENGIIYWHSDSYDSYEYASILRIEKKDNDIIISFIKSKSHEEHPFIIPTHTVRITEVGNRYGSFFVIFSNFRRNLQGVDWPNQTLPDSKNESFQKLLI